MNTLYTQAWSIEFNT